MDCWGKEETELGLKLCCSPVKRKRRHSCSLDLYNGSSCENIAGITESLRNSNNSSSADPVGEPKEQDLIRCLMKSYSGSKYNSLVSLSTDVDCTLSLGIPQSSRSPEEQNLMRIYKKSTMEEVIEVMKCTLLSQKIISSELEASYNTTVPFDRLYNISSSVNKNVYGSQQSAATNVATTSNPISWFPTAHSRSKFMVSKDILAHKNYATDLGSELQPKRPKKTSNSSPVNNNNGNSISTAQQKQISNITSDDAARWCSTCQTIATPLWSNGPKGAKSLCNACGIRYKKEERRVASAMAAAAESNNQFVKASCSDPIVDHTKKITAAPHLKPLKKMKLQPIGAEDFPLLTATFKGI